LCRIADTIEDSPELPDAERPGLLSRFAASLEAPESDLSPLVRPFAEAESPDALLVANSAAVLRRYWRLPAADQSSMRGPITTMCHGMGRFVQSFRRGTRGLEGPANLAELEEYCYYVAGTVGELLTELFCLHMRHNAEARYPQLLRLARGYGLGLQLTNIIRDMRDDSAQGRRYFPRELGDPEDERSNEVLQRRALTHLEDGLNYCTSLPRAELRIRLFCLMPLILAARTLRLIAQSRLGPTGPLRIKVSRPGVYALLSLCVIAAPSNQLIRLFYRSVAPGGLHPAAVDQGISARLPP
ncbi:MAG TPA: squalene/phytoene synthase family protein, partial [Gemmatimonadales bacterium]|jgi:farnesyl-diphosphate farnesyltransferase|nr:squalene/phytoene synthase family protein [Gemmatimonadales bacterium]